MMGWIYWTCFLSHLLSPVCLHCSSKIVYSSKRVKKMEGTRVKEKGVSGQKKLRVWRPDCDHWHAWRNSLCSAGQQMVYRHCRTQCAAAHMQVLLAFPTLGYSGPPCHCGGFHSPPMRKKSVREKSWETEASAALIGVRRPAFLFIHFCTMSCCLMLFDLSQQDQQQNRQLLLMIAAVSMMLLHTS